MIGLPWWLSGKESAFPGRRHGFNPWEIWRRKWQSILVFFPGKSHDQRRLVGYSQWGHKRVGHDWATKQQQLTSPSKPLSCFLIRYSFFPSVPSGTWVLREAHCSAWSSTAPTVEPGRESRLTLGTIKEGTDACPYTQYHTSATTPGTEWHWYVVWWLKSH